MSDQLFHILNGVEFSIFSGEFIIVPIKNFEFLIVVFYTKKFLWRQK